MGRMDGRKNRGPLGFPLLVAMAGFWLVNTLYQFVIPMPLPPALWALHIGFVGYAILTTIAYVAALIALRKQ